MLFLILSMMAVASKGRIDDERASGFRHSNVFDGVADDVYIWLEPDAEASTGAGDWVVCHDMPHDADAY